ncbi:MAG: hypothetical protein KAT16_02485 [Candidatus Heimdallarchaeota archaeon]|nr:hypothetical protein [Candidatus Heimdallarchaeota archaeon]
MNLNSNIIYNKPKSSEVTAPFLKISVGDPFSEKSISFDALIDTGYDGNLIVPYYVFNQLDLFRFQYPEEIEAVGEMLSGDKISLTSAEASICIENTEYEFIVLIDTFESCNEVLVGREFINSFILTLNGPNKSGTLIFSS